jgi:hypothetical protein
MVAFVHKEIAMSESNLKEALVAAFELLKAQNAKIYAMACDLSALRTVVCEKSLEAPTRHIELLAAEVEKTRSQISADSKVYDDLILALKSANRWLN